MNGTYLSPEETLTSGIVQGSGIGPVLIFLYIDDLAKLVKHHGIAVKLLADDIKVYLEIVD